VGAGADTGANARSPFDPAQVKLVRAAGTASVAAAITLIVLKSWAWLQTDSVAVLGSLADSLLDLLASLITFFAVRVAVTPADREHRFGHGKSEAVASLAQAVIVSGSSLYVGIQAVARLFAPAEVARPELGSAVLLVSVLLTASLVAFQRYVIRRTGSLAISADAVHYRADILTGTAVLVAIFLNARLNWHLADPVLALVIVGLILASVRTIAIGALDVLLDRELPTDIRERIRATAAAHPAVRGVHDIRTRSAGATQFVQLHIELDAGLTLQQVHGISTEVEARVQATFPHAEVLIHTDPYGYPDSRDPF
jgi:ferrous-iron efflux pump FieF